MARIRYLKPEFFKDTRLRRVSLPCRYLFAGLWGLMDRDGVMVFDHAQIKIEVFPWDDEIGEDDVFEMCCALSQIGVIKVFKHGEKLYLYCPKFRFHQNFHRDEKPKHNINLKSVHMIPSDQLTPRFTGASTVPAPCKHGACTTGNGERGTGNGEQLHSSTNVEECSRKPRKRRSKAKPKSEKKPNLAGELPEKMHDALVALRDHFGLDSSQYATPKYALYNKAINEIRQQLGENKSSEDAANLIMASWENLKHDDWPSRRYSLTPEILCSTKTINRGLDLGTQKQSKISEATGIYALD